MSNSELEFSDPWHVKELSSGYIKITHEDYFNFCQIPKSQWPYVDEEYVRDNSFRPYMDDFVIDLVVFAHGFKIGKEAVDSAFDNI